MGLCLLYKYEYAHKSYTLCYAPMFIQKDVVSYESVEHVLQFYCIAWGDTTKLL